MSVVPIRSLPKMSDQRDANARIDTHEAVCAERYAGLNAQLRRLEGWFVTLVIGIVGLLVTIVLKVGV